MNKIGLIGSLEFLSLDNMEIIKEESVETAFGEPSSKLTHGLLQGREVIVIARSGPCGKIPPHQINYRANIWAMHQAGVKHIISLAPTKGIRADMAPGLIVVPDQLIDYTYARQHTFYDDDFHAAFHLDFRYPYDEPLRQVILESASNCSIDVCEEATYGVIQGPRFTSLAEINRLERDGCNMVGMTGMPETVLARELKLSYVCLALVTDKAAGRQAGLLASKEDIGSVLKQRLRVLHQLLEQSVLNVPV